MERAVDGWVETLEHDVGFLGFVDFHHLDLLDLGADDFGEGGFADLALELGEVIRCSQPQILLFNLIVNPLPQTIRMNISTIPFTIARRYHGILHGLLIAQTNLTVNIVLLHLCPLPSHLALQLSFHQNVKNLLAVALLQVSRIPIRLSVFSVE